MLTSCIILLPPLLLLVAKTRRTVLQHTAKKKTKKKKKPKKKTESGRQTANGIRHLTVEKNWKCLKRKLDFNSTGGKRKR